MRSEGSQAVQGQTIVFVHGMYMTPLCWEHWVAYFGTKGYSCFAPAWPGRDPPVDVLRKRHPDPQLGRLTLGDVVRDLEQGISALPDKPVLIGHSMGGLAVQLLLQRGLAAAGVAIDSAPPMGVFTTQWSFLRSNWPHITPFAKLSEPIAMSFERFQYTYVNGMPLAQQQAAFERYIVPESRRVPRESLTARIDFWKPHAPLLFVAGSNDHIIPAQLNRFNSVKYRHAESPVTYKEFAGRNHFIIGQDGWQEVAQFVEQWLRSLPA